jgi:hypothetical protein
MKIRITSVVRRADDSTGVHWSDNNRRGFTDPADNSLFAVSTPLAATGDTVVVAEVRYDYKSSVGFLFDTRTLLHRAEMRPRRSRDVGYTPATTTPARMFCSS